MRETKGDRARKRERERKDTERASSGSDGKLETDVSTLCQALEFLTSAKRRIK